VVAGEEVVTTFDENYQRALAAAGAPAAEEEDELTQAKKLVGKRIFLADGAHGVVIKVEKESKYYDPWLEVLSEGGGHWIADTVKSVSFAKVVKSEDLPKKAKHKGPTELAGRSIWSASFWHGFHTYEEVKGKPFIAWYTSLSKEPTITITRWPVTGVKGDPYGPRGTTPSGAVVERRDSGVYVHPTTRNTFFIDSKAQGTQEEIKVPEPAGKTAHRWRDGRWEKFVGGTWKNFA
jgi:hypothetical protein